MTTETFLGVKAAGAEDC